MLISCWNKIPAGNVVLETSSNPQKTPPHTTPLSAVIRANHLSRSRWINSLWWEYVLQISHRTMMLTLSKYLQHLEWKLFCINHKWICIQGGHVGVFSRSQLSAQHKIKRRRDSVYFLFVGEEADTNSAGSNWKGTTGEQSKPCSMDYPLFKLFLKEKLSLGIKLCSLRTISVQRNTRIKFRRLLKSWTMSVCSKLWLFSDTELPSDWQRGQSNFGPPDGWKAPSSRTQWQ